jgi:CPA1 family monovalent cation:H+ antiporter
MTESIAIYLLILALGCGLSAVAKRIEIPYPIVLVPAGILLSFVPGMPEVPLNAEIALSCFLPLLIYAGVASSSWRDFLADIRAISLLAVGHVIFATVVIAALAHYLIPGFPWPEALVLGAVVAPPDEVAAIQILRRLGIPHRVLSVLEGEGMANDATSLTLYRIALGAIATHRIIYSDAAVLFGSVVVGEVAWGLAVGWLVTWIRRKVDDTSIASVLSILTPFLAYIPAERMGGSGVLATVVAAFYVGTHSHRLFSPRMRIRDSNIWLSIDFLLNCLLFILTGLQLRGIIARQHGVSFGRMCGYALAVGAVLVAARFVWVFPATYLPRFLSPALRRKDPYPPWQSIFVVSFTGLRGAISLAAAMALPETIGDQPFAARDLIIFITFSSIFITLVAQGLCLPSLVRALGLGAQVEREEREHRKMEIRARLAAVTAGLAKLEVLDQSDNAPHFIAFLRRQYDGRAQFLRARGAACETPAQEEEMLSVMRSVRSAERQALHELQDRGTITDRVMVEVEEDVDLEELKFDSEG